MGQTGAITNAAARPERRRRISAWWRSYGWWVAGGVAIAAFVMGLLGFEERFDLLGEPHSLWDSAYLSIQLFVLASGGVAGTVPWTLEVARWLAPLVFTYAAARALVSLFRDQIRLLGLRFLSGHVIVCGLGDKGMSLVRSLGETGRRIVVVERDAENDLIEPARERGALVLIGDAQDADLLKHAGVATAAHLIAVCGADSTNAEIAVKAMRLTTDRRGESLVGVVHIVDPELCALLRTEELAMPSHRGFTLEFFNIFEHGARMLLEDQATSPFYQAEPGGTHLIVVGLGRFGTSVVVQAGRSWDNSGEQITGELRITLVGKDADEKRARFESRHPMLRGRSRLEIEKLDIESADFHQASFMDDDPSAIFICIDDDPLAVSAALSLQRALKGREIPIVVRVAHATGLASLLERGSAIGGDNKALHPFGLLDETCRVNVLEGVYEKMAQELHAAYLGRPLEDGEWAALADGFKASNRAQAAHTGAKIRAVECGLMPFADQQSAAFRFTPAEIELLAMLEHDRWCAWTLDHGYRYGEERVDRSEFTRKYVPWVKGRRPQLRPWGELSDDVQDIDCTFIRHLPEVLTRVDQRIVRLDEKLPRAIHAAYLQDCEQAGETPGTNPSMRPWSALPETLKNANRDQAAHLRIKLRVIGCDLEPATEGDGSRQPFEFTPTEFEQLAELEHDRWVAQRLADGWQYDPTKDLDRKLSPHLVPWDELDQGVKDLDRDVIRHLPETAALAGYEIVRGRPGESPCGR